MLHEICVEILDAIDAVFSTMAEKDYLSFILFIGRGDVIHGLNSIVGSDYVIDYQLDRYHDRTREVFYTRYLKRNYSREGFHYEGESGIDGKPPSWRRVI